MNDENLIQNHDTRTPSERRACASAAGRASGRARRIKKQGRELLRELLSLRETDPKLLHDLATSHGINENDITSEMAMHLRQIDKAIRKADTYAYQTVLKTAGYLSEDINIGARDGASIEVTVGSQEAADGLRKALATGAQPASPDGESDPMP